MGFLRNMGGMELGIILGIVVLLFGPKQIPKLGKMFGDTIREVRKTKRELQAEADEVNTALKDASIDLRREL